MEQKINTFQYGTQHLFRFDLDPVWLLSPSWPLFAGRFEQINGFRYQSLRQRLREAAIKYGVAIHAWVFMTNHIHLLVTPTSHDSISKTTQYQGRYYVRYFNYRYRRTGTLFEGRFKSSLVQSQNYFLACQRYIELNPVRAGMVSDPANYKRSSYNAHAFGRAFRMWYPHPEYMALGQTVQKRRSEYRKLFTRELDHAVINDIRHAINTGLVFGNERFRKEVEQLTGQRQSHLKRGPKPKNTS